MRIVSNTGTDRVADLIGPLLRSGHQIDLASKVFSLYAFGELAEKLSSVAKARLIFPPDLAELNLSGNDADRAARNRLQSRWIARRCADWVEEKAEVRLAAQPIPQGAIALRNGDGSPQQVVHGSFSFSTDGLGLTPGNPFNLVQVSESPEESVRLCEWYEGQWSALSAGIEAKSEFVGPVAFSFSASESTQHLCINTAPPFSHTGR